MSDPEAIVDGVDIEDVADAAEEGGGGRRSKRALALLLLLLLLLCTVTTTVDVWVNRGPDEARFITRNLACLQCHTELIPEMSKASVHNPFMLETCTTCHTEHGKEVERTITSGPSETWQRFQTVVEWLPLKWVLSIFDGVAGRTGSSEGGDLISQDVVRDKGQTSYLVAEEQDLCWICHGSMGAKLAEQHQHAPFEKGFCTNCHNPHASDHRVLLQQDEKDLCITCHPIGPELAREQVHPPVEGRFCTTCHDPHASNWKGILVDNQRDLCFVCHPSVAPLSLKAVQHQPFLYDNCTGCHEPHGSNYRPLLIKDQPPLCYDCHPGIADDFLRESHHPVGTADLNCADCHDPHGADYPALLTAKDNEMCYQCHAQPIQVTYDDSAHFDTLCVECHTPHGSDYAPILRDSNPDLCLGCHTAYEGGNQHPVRPVFYDVYAGKGLTCSTTCHDPHGTVYNYMLQRFRFPQDGQCLQCHYDVGVTF